MAINWQNSRLVIFSLALIFAIPYSIIAYNTVHVPIVSIILLSTTIFYLLLLNLKLIKSQKLRAVYVIVSFLKLWLLIYVTYAKPHFLSGVDWYNFNNYALAAISHGSNIIDIYNNSLDLFVFIMALIYKLFGPLVDQIYFVVFACSLLVFRYVFKTVRLIGGSEILGAIAALVIMLWPVDAIFSVSLLREVPIQLIIIVSFYYFVKYLKNGGRKNLIASLVLSMFAAMMHSGMIALGIVYIYVLFQGKLTKRRRIISLSALLLTSLATGLLLSTPIGGAITTRFSDIGSISDINQQFEFQLQANTTYVTAVPGSLGELVVSIPYRFVMFAVSPLPWQVNSFETLVSFLIDGILQIILIIFIYKALKRSKRSSVFLRNVVVTAALCITITYLIFSVGTNNYGSAMRHRTKVLPIVIVLVSTYYITGKPNNIKLVKSSIKIESDMQ